MSATDNLPSFCTLREWADTFGYSLRTAEEYARKKKIPAVKVGARWFVDLERQAEQMRGKAS